MDKTIREVRHKQWENIVKQCHARPQGQTAKQWLSEPGISDKTYYYWQRTLRQEAYEQMKQAENFRRPVRTQISHSRSFPFHKVQALRLRIRYHSMQMLSFRLASARSPSLIQLQSSF